ncbi:hypothetical protein ABGB07_28155 [Micromonosporaceae bacterium B7E4]
MDWSSPVSRIRWAGDVAVGTLLVAADVSYVTSDTAEPVASAETVGDLAERGGAVDGPLGPIARPDPWR